jgi:hypothetical protein
MYNHTHTPALLPITLLHTPATKLQHTYRMQDLLYPAPAVFHIPCIHKTYSYTGCRVWQPLLVAAWYVSLALFMCQLLHHCVNASLLLYRIPVGAPLGRGITCYRNRRDCEGEMRSPK